MTQPAPRTSHDPSSAPQRALGFWMCTALVVGNIIGMGIFLLPAGLAPYGFNATLGWVITLAGCLVLARVFARLARESQALAVAGKRKTVMDHDITKARAKIESGGL